MTGRLLTLIAALIAIASPARADEFKPAYLQLRAIDPEKVEVLWKIPALDETTVLGLRPAFPDGTKDLTPRTSRYAAGAAVIQWTARVPGGLEGKSVRFDRLAQSRTDVLVRYQRADGTEQVARVLPVDPVVRFTASPGPFEVALTYTRIGIEHILLGVDHLLFVLALVLLVAGRRKLLWTVTAFTVAHSITLALATLKVIHVPGPPVEAAIALSIVFVAGEILHRRKGTAGLAARAPWIAAFSFGLLHGLGFAGALAEVGLPENAIPLALLFFNVGVEIGQLLFIAAVLTTIAIARRGLAKLRPFGKVPPGWSGAVAPYAIGIMASFWLFERIAKF